MKSMALIYNTIEEPEAYYQQFVAIEGRLKRWQVEADLLVLQNPDKEVYEKITRDTFSRIRIELSEFMGYAIREHDTSTEDFALMIKKLSAHNKSLNNRHKHKEAA